MWVSLSEYVASEPAVTYTAADFFRMKEEQLNAAAAELLQHWPAVEAAQLKADLAAEALSRSKRRSRRPRSGPSARSAEQSRGFPVFVPAACANAGASQFGVRWTETLGADPRTEPCAVSASDRAWVPRHTVFQPLRTDNVARLKKSSSSSSSISLADKPVSSHDRQCLCHRRHIFRHAIHKSFVG